MIPDTGPGALTGNFRAGVRAIRDADKLPRYAETVMLERHIAG
jgi:hypothetical protein